MTCPIQPPGAQNYSIGWDGPADRKTLVVTDSCADILGWLKQRSMVQFAYKGVPIMGDGTVESPTQPVTLRST